MEQEPEVKQVSAKQERARKTIREGRRATRRKFSSEEKIRIVLEGLRGEEMISELCRREGIAPTVYYKWSKAFLEAGKQRLVGETKLCSPENSCGGNSGISAVDDALPAHTTRSSSTPLRSGAIRSAIRSA